MSARIQGQTPQRLKDARLKDQRLLLIRQRVENGYYNSEPVIREVVQSLLETFVPRRAGSVDLVQDAPPEGENVEQ